MNYYERQEDKVMLRKTKTKSDHSRVNVKARNVSCIVSLGVESFALQPARCGVVGQNEHYLTHIAVAVDVADTYA